MPMIPEAMVAMHACVRLGAIHSVVFGGFAPEELANRIKTTNPKILITASAGLEPNRIIPYTENVDKACDLSGHSELKRIIVQRRSYKEKDINKKVYLDYNEEMSKIT